MKKFSVIVPVYNRPVEVADLLGSLQRQSCRNFEVLIVEDGSSRDCAAVVNSYAADLDLTYFYKDNSGPGDSRNFGMARAKGQYLLFFDSDCLIPPGYFEALERALALRPLDAFGGPDAADDAFSRVQKAINYAMTSVITTGGVRGRQNRLDNYQPRSFNMGISREVYARVGGFSDIHPGEDPDLSYRIMNAGFRVGLIAGAFVYHKRRVDFSSFLRQVYKFGVVRTILIKWYPDKWKVTYLLPTLFLLASLLLTGLSLAFSGWFMLPLLLVWLVIVAEALVKTRSLTIALLSWVASLVQLYGYGCGFLHGAVRLGLLGQDERSAFKKFFFRSPPPR